MTAVIRTRRQVALISHSCRACTKEIRMQDEHLAVLILRLGERPERFSVCTSCARRFRSGGGVVEVAG